jgi:hypothetical protein
MGFPPSHAPAPVAPKHMMQPRPARTPSQSIALPPAVAGARHTGVTRPVYIIAAVSVALLVWCGYRSSMVVTVRPWATGLSGQLQKAFVTGAVPSSSSLFRCSASWERFDRRLPALRSCRCAFPEEVGAAAHLRGFQQRHRRLVLLHGVQGDAVERRRDRGGVHDQDLC